MGASVDLRVAVAFALALALVGACVDGPGVTTGATSGASEGSTGDELETGGACMIDAPAPLPGPPFAPAICGSWEEGALAPADPGAPLACGEGGPCPTFSDVTAAAGLVYAQAIPTSPDAGECLFDLPAGDGVLPNAECEPEWSSAGAAAGDYDGDGWPDLYVTRQGAPDLLFHNRGDGTFDEVAAAVGLGACTFTNGAAWADVDGDGDLDLAVTAMGGPAHHLFINHGGCFVDEAAARGFALAVAGLHSGESVTFGDYDLDGELDAHINEWIDADLADQGGPWGSRLLRGLGGGVFADVTDAAGVSIAGPLPPRPGAWGFTSTFVDLDDDGWPELAIAADYGQARLFWNGGDGTFSEGAAAAGVAGEGNAMGSAFGDVDGDGRLDWFVSAIAEANPEGCPIDQCLWRGTGNRLYRNRGDRTFADITDAAGVRDGGWGWGASLFDADHDGDLDLVQTNGWPGRGVYQTFVHLDTPTRLWLAEGGVFVEGAAARGLADRGQGRGLVTFDYDRDGDLDVFIANHAGRPALLRNDGGDALPWLVVEAPGTRSVADGRGAVVRLQARADGPVQVRQIGVGGHFLGEGELAAHFGLGPGVDRVHELRVRWPASAAEVVLSDLDARARVRVVEP